MENTQYLNEALDLLRRLIATPRVSRREQQAADVMAHEVSRCGFIPLREKNNVWALCNSFVSARPTLLLNAHLDTVAPVASWTRDPYSPQDVDGCIYGLGSNDCGGGLVTLWQIFRILNEHPQAYNVVFLASSEEEVSGSNGISSVLPLLPRIDVAIVGEPTGMQPAIAEKGLMVLDVVAHGRSGHAARGEGINAIYRMLPDVEWISHYQFKRISPLLGPTKMNLTMVNAGTQHNVIPDVCRAVVDVRTNECYTNHEVFDIIRRHLNSDVTARSFRLESSHIAASHPLVRQCIRLGLKPFGSPTLSDQALMPWPSLKLGPGESSRSHTADEFVRIDELAQALDAYRALLFGLEL